MSSQSHAFFVTYVNETAFDSCVNKLKNIRKLTQEIIDQLEFPDNLNQNMKDGGMMIPVNMPRLEAEFHSVKEMAQQLGLRATVEAFRKGRADFEENKHKLAKQYKTCPTTAAEIMTQLEKMEELRSEEAEEEPNEGDEEEDVSDDDGEEPPSKKARGS